jgi:hypothetical protein
MLAAVAMAAALLLAVGLGLARQYQSFKAEDQSRRFDRTVAEAKPNEIPDRTSNEILFKDREKKKVADGKEQTTSPSQNDPWTTTTGKQSSAGTGTDKGGGRKVPGVSDPDVSLEKPADRSPPSPPHDKGKDEKQAGDALPGGVPPGPVEPTSQPVTHRPEGDKSAGGESKNGGEGRGAGKDGQGGPGGEGGRETGGQKGEQDSADSIYLARRQNRGPGGSPGRSTESGKPGAAVDELKQQAESASLRRLQEEVEVLRREVRETSVGNAVAFERAKARLKAVEERLEKNKSSLVLTGDKKKAEEKKPVVWHRESRQPTFARVYIGDGNALELVSLQVTTTIEGPRARTVVDHIFHNPHGRQLEGTFEYPLPSGASPSYFAMFLGQTTDTLPARFARRGDAPALPADALVRLRPEELVRQVSTADWGKLQEARIVSHEKALETYEEVVRGRVDPALMEYAGGNTFRGRVFPIPPNGYNRVILAYEELLPLTGNRMVYRFPLPGCPLHDMHFALQAPENECLKPTIQPADAHQETSTGRLLVSRHWGKGTPKGEILFTCMPAQPEIQAISGRPGENGPHYAYARIRPPSKEAAGGKPFASQAVFLLDTSLSEHPDRFDVSMRLLRKILEGDKNIKEFNVLTFNVGAAWVDPKGWLPNTPAGRNKALARLDGLVLEGATDLTCALEKLARPGFEVTAGTRLDCFLLSDGHITWGDGDVASMVARFEQRCPFSTRFHCYRTGLGEENQELYEALTRRGGGIFQCFGEADVAAAARAHRSVCMQVERVRFVGGPAASDILVGGRRAALYPGGELVVAARFQGTGRTTLLVEGKYQGQPIVHEFPMEVKSGSELAPRGWAEIAVASLLALHDSKLDGLVTAYCQQFGIVSRAASFLVLENDAEYKRFNLEEERGKSVDGDMGDYLTTMWQQMGKSITARESFSRFFKQVEKRVPLTTGPQGAHVARLLALMHDKDFEVPAGHIDGGLLRAKEVPPEYLAHLLKGDRRDVHPYLAEARRRAEAGDVSAAVRALSTVIEVHPQRSDALRLVGYRLIDLKQAGPAVRLFEQVQRQRPFEPHSYRDLARALEETGRFGLAALQYEIMLAGDWHARFHESLKVVAQEEYARMMQDAIRRKAVRKELADHFGERLEHMGTPQPQSDLRVTISWNTDATDVDLWVIEPEGTKCYFQHQKTENGGELSQDQTQGYGPERYQIKSAKPGTYTVFVHYFAANPNLLAGETHVSVSVVRKAGTPQETEERHTILLKNANEQVEVCKVKFGK